MAGESQQIPAGAPDPTVLTTEQLLREVQNVKDWTEALVQAAKELNLVEFKHVSEILALIERQRVEQKKDTKDAVDAALSAAKEAVQEQTKASAEAIAKSEGQFSAVQQQSTTQYETGIKAQGEKVDDLKERVVRLETTRSTEDTGRNQQRLDYGLLVSVASIFVSIIAVVVVVLLSAKP